MKKKQTLVLEMVSRPSSKRKAFALLTEAANFINEEPESQKLGIRVYVERVVRGRKPWAQDR